MKSDESILASIPEFFSIESMLKATPAQEGDKRFIYLEASREVRDQQNDVVLAKALEASADHYLKFGNIDIDHKSMPAVAKIFGIERPELWEIGTPVDVRIDGMSTFVKAQVFSGDTPLAEKANDFWDSITKLSPPRKWYPSVGGKVLAKSIKLDQKTGDKIGVVSQVRWTNVALSQQPVNQDVPGVATIPFGVLAKSWIGGELNIAKALEASYATDAVGKVGGGALGMQSLDSKPKSYFKFRDMLAKAVQSRDVPSMKPSGLVSYSAKKFGLSRDEAAEWVDRFLGDLKAGLSNQRSK